MPRTDGPFKALKRVNNNAYKVNLPNDYGVSAAFNVADLSPYLEDDHSANLMATSPQRECFAGKLVIFGGDFRQILSVVIHGSRESIIATIVH